MVSPFLRGNKGTHTRSPIYLMCRTVHLHAIWINNLTGVRLEVACIFSACNRVFPITYMHFILHVYFARNPYLKLTHFTDAFSVLVFSFTNHVPQHIFKTISMHFSLSKKLRYSPGSHPKYWFLMPAHLLCMLHLQRDTLIIFSNRRWDIERMFWENDSFPRTGKL